MDLKEKSSHGTPAFPVAMYNNLFDKTITTLAHLHYHNELELLIITKGSITVRIEEQSYKLLSGQGIFINSGLLHSLLSDGTSECGFLAIVFDHKFICNDNEIIFEKYISPLINGHLHISPLLNTQLCNLIKSAYSLYSSNSYAMELYVKQNLSNILYLLLNHAQSDPTNTVNTKNFLIKNALDFIYEKYAEDISLQDIADHVHISKEYLCRIFTGMSDTSPIVFLNRYRIDQSRYYLINTDKNISEIASLCGFNNSSYYNKLFMRYIGCTPTLYRKSINSNKSPNMH